MTTTHHPSDNRMARGLAATHSIPELVTRLFRDTSDLYHKEAKLLRTELSEKATQAKVALGKIISGALILLASLIVLSQALVSGIANIFTEIQGGVVDESAADMVATNIGWAQLIVGIAFAIVGALLVRAGTEEIEPDSLAPERTTEQLRRDANLAKEQIQ